MRTFKNHEELNKALSLAPLEIGAFRFAKQFSPASFICSVCNEVKPLNFEGGATGYGCDQDTNNLVCFDCCAIKDKGDMINTCKAVLYLCDKPNRVTNWPGTLSFSVGHVNKTRHNIARWRYDFHFVGPDNAIWRGTQYGDNTQLARCTRTKLKKL